MKRTIFYSWQSDLDPALTRNFIEDALKSAVRKIARDDDLLVDPVLDRDTAGIAGTPAISEAIFEKIQTCDVFVADVSIINSRNFLAGWIGKTNRLTPNPNVLVELGFAVTHLGWDRILLVLNTHFGNPDSLPFDLRGRRVVPYAVDRKSPDRPGEKAKLRERLESALRLALADVSGNFVKPKQSEPRWWGYWELQEHGSNQGGTLFIREVGPRSFLFNIFVVNGSHIGNVTGVARFTTPYSAYACLTAGKEDQICELSFRKNSESPREIAVKESGKCHWFRGMGVGFGGTFMRRIDTVFDFGFLDELDLARLYGITGNYYQPMLDCFHRVGRGDNKDTFIAEVFNGGVAGLYTIKEGIIMRGEHGQLWAAYIDGDIVRYFTTEMDYKQKLPLTIEEWRKRFQEKRVVCDSPVRIIPSI